MPTRVLVPLAALLLALAGCDGGPRFATPTFFAVGATLPEGAEAIDLEVLAHNRTEAPMWIRRLDVHLTVAGDTLARGLWDGDRMLEPGTGVVLPLRMPLADGAAIPKTDMPAEIHLNTRYARSGLIGVLGGETHTFELATVLRRTAPTPP